MQWLVKLDGFYLSQDLTWVERKIAKRFASRREAQAAKDEVEDLSQDQIRIVRVVQPADKQKQRSSLKTIAVLACSVLGWRITK
jgi:hypothetical protein